MSKPPESSGSSPGPEDPPARKPPEGGDDAAGDRPAAANDPAGGRPRDEPAFNPERAWRESFDAYERAVGRPMEAFMASEEFADAAAQFFKANARLQSELQRGSRGLAELWNLPSLEDVRGLRTAVDEVALQLGEITERLDAIEAKLG